MIELFFFCIFSLFCSPSERTGEDLEIIYEELLHIKALAHLSTTVSRGGHLARFIEKDCKNCDQSCIHRKPDMALKKINLLSKFSY